MIACRSEEGAVKNSSEFSGWSKGRMTGQFTDEIALRWRRSSWEGRDQEFGFGHVEMQVPMSHPSEDVRRMVIYMGLSPEVFVGNKI